jgi:hypothetical protein
MRISKKAIREINFLISNVISLNNVEEFQASGHKRLFAGPRLYGNRKKILSVIIRAGS